MTRLGDFDWTGWLLGLLSTMISGGAGAIVTAPIVASFNPTALGFSSGHFYELLWTLFASHAVVAAANFLVRSPIANRTTTTTVDSTTTTTIVKDK